MKKTLLVMLALLLAVGAASASTIQKWTAGWDNFSEPLNYKKSKVVWSVNPTTKKLSVTYTLVGATPSKLYQVDLAFFLLHVSQHLWPVSRPGLQQRQHLPNRHAPRCHSGRSVCRGGRGHDRH